MSDSREQSDDGSGLRAVSAWLGDYYHYLLVAGLMVFAFWIRVQNWGRYVVDGQILFRGNDPWYHYRSVEYVVGHFPATMPFDPWTYFPLGTANAQFGTMFDQLIGLGALLAGLGSPSDELVRQVLLFAPAIFGVAIAIPTYVIGRRLGGRFAGVVSVGLFAFAADRLLTLSVAGFSDHQVAEALFQAVAVLGVLVALRAAHQEKPVYELVADREFTALRGSIAWSLLAGVGISLYLWVWPPGVLLLGILGVFFVVHLSLEFLRGRSPEHAAFVGAIALGTAGILQLSSTHTLDISATSRSILQPGLALAVAFGTVFMAWLAREWDDRDLTPYGYPATVVGILVAGALFMYLALPGLFNFFLNNTLRVLGLSTSAVGATIGEVQPMAIDQLYNYYNFAIFGAGAGLAIVIARQWLGSERRAEELFVGIWFVFIVFASLTQGRFAYYLTVPVAALNAVFVGFVMQSVGDIDNVLDIEPSQVMAILAVLLIVVGPSIAPVVAGGSNGAVAVAGGSQGAGGVVGWAGSLSWLSDNTPAEGQYANPNGTEMQYLGTYSRTDDYDYPEGAYGVMSWWDYGHWITALGDRIPNANPFQQGATDAARYLLSQGENQSREVLSDIDEADAQTRYVMVDWKMAETESLRPVQGKFFAPPSFVDNVSQSDFYSRVIDTGSLEEGGGLYGSTDLLLHKQAYYNSTLARLYLYHGSAQSPGPYVVDWDGPERPLSDLYRSGAPAGSYVTVPSEQSPVKMFPNMTAAQAYVQNDSTAQLGGIGPYPSERVPALEHYRLVHMSDVNAVQSGGQYYEYARTLQQSGLGGAIQSQLGPDANATAAQNAAFNFLYPNTPAWTKTFERVDGATIAGEGGPANTTLTLSASLDPENGRTFSYTQQVETGPDGTFETTVPYATTGYDEVGPEDGYTNTSVRALGPYRITGFGFSEDGNLSRYSGQVNVSEASVVGADDEVARVELQRATGGADDNETSNGASAEQVQSPAIEGAETLAEPVDSTTDGASAPTARTALSVPAALTGPHPVVAP